MNKSSNSPYRFVRRRWHLLFAVVDAIGWWFVRIFSRKSIGPPERLEPRAVRRLLIVQLDHLGDAVLTTSMLPAIRQAYRNAEIEVLASEWNADVFRMRDDVDRVLVSRWNRFRRGLAWLWPASLVYWSRQLRKRKYDLAIDVRGDFVHALMLRWAGIPRRVGWPAAGGGFLLTDMVPYVAGRHEVESRHAILSTLGIGFRKVAPPTMPVSPDADRYVAHLLGDFRRGPQSLFVFHLGAGTPAKQWPVAHWRELVGRVVVELDARVILVGGRSDAELARQVTGDQFWPGVMDWTGRLTIEQLAALARRATAFVGGDSGPAHTAAAAGGEVVVLFGGSTDPEQWRPWGEKVHVLRRSTECAGCRLAECRFADHPCLTNLAPAAVVEKLRDFVDLPQIVPMPKFLSSRRQRTDEMT